MFDTRDGSTTAPRRSRPLPDRQSAEPASRRPSGDTPAPSLLDLADVQNSPAEMRKPRRFRSPVVSLPERPPAAPQAATAQTSGPKAAEPQKSARIRGDGFAETSRMGGLLGAWFSNRNDRQMLSPAHAADNAQHHAASGSDETDEQGRERPLVDLATIIASIWQVRRIVVATTILGAVGGVALALATPSTYRSETKLYIDPREVQLTDSDLSQGSLATEGILALVDSQLEVLRSRDVLLKVATDLGLERDPEFGGKAPGSFALPSIRDLIFGKTAASSSSPAGRMLDKLDDALNVSRDPKTFIVTVDVTTRDAEKSALIANRIVDTFLDEEQQAQSVFFQRTTEALDGRIKQLGSELDLAERAVEKFKAENDIVGASGELISDKQLLSLNDQVGAAGTRIAEARAKVDVVTRIQLNDVLTGALPEEVNSPTLAELRKQYSAARGQLGALEANLGPRHPQRLAAVQSLEVARDEIGNELSRIAGRAQTELQRAEKTEQDLMRQLNVQKARQINSSSGFVELRELERNASATRAIYESFLKRARETSEEEKLTTKNIRVISSAQPALKPSGTSRSVIAIGMTVAGFFLGIGIGIALGIVRSLSRLFSPSRSTADRLEAPAASIMPAPVLPREALHDMAPQPRTAPPIRPAAADRYQPDGNSEDEDAFARPTSRSRQQAPHRPRSAVRPSDDAALAWRAAYAATDYPEEREPLPASSSVDADVADLQENIRALRARVAQYARQKQAAGY